jgi:hypothetical protein
MELLNYISSLAQQIVDNKMDFVRLEQEIFRMVKAFGALVMEKVIQEADNRIFAQENRPGKSEGFREMGIQTLFGEICYRRRLYHDQRTWRYLLDEKLGIQDKQTISPTLVKASAYMATQNSYRESAKMLRQVGIHMSHQRIHQAVQDIGEAIEQRQAENHNRAGEGTRKADIVVVESDGVYVPLQREDRKKAKSLEIKVGCVYEGWEAADPRGSRFRLVNAKVLATTGTAEEYWKRVDRYLLSTYDLENVKLLVFGSDGAPWGQYGTELYANSLHQIDRFHFQRWIKGVFGFQQQAIVDTIEALIEADDQQGFEEFMEVQKTKYPDKKKDIEKLKKTIKRNWESLGDYRHRAASLPEIARGLGNVENANDNLVADRMKKRGMAWSIRGANHLVQVKAAVRNGEWDDVCRWMMEQAEHLEKRQEDEPKVETNKRGRKRRGFQRKQEVGAWCQAHIPGGEGCEAWLREFSKMLKQVTNPAM